MVSCRFGQSISSQPGAAVLTAIGKPANAARGIHAATGLLIILQMTFQRFAYQCDVRPSFQPIIWLFPAKEDRRET
jgi:hypothetical protein